MGEGLGDLQRDFAAALLHANAEPRVLGVLAGETGRNRDFLACHRNNLFRTWVRMLARTYPVLRALVGDAFFVTLAREYGLADSSCLADSTRFGHRMADLLAAWPPSSPYRYLEDVARLEWIVRRAYFAANKSPWTSERWARHAPDAFDTSAIELHPAVGLLHPATRAADIWRAHRRGGSEFKAIDIDEPQWIVVTRPEWAPRVLTVSPAVFAMLEALREGATVRDARKAAWACDSEFDFAAAWAMCVEHGVVVEPDFRDPSSDEGAGRAGSAAHKRRA